MLRRKNSVADDAEYPPDHTEANVPKGHKKGRRPPSMELDQWCDPGPFDSKEELWTQLDKYNELLAKWDRCHYTAVPLKTVAQYFGLTEDELNKEFTSPSFAKYCMARSKINAQMLLRHHHAIASKKLEELAAKDAKQYLMEFNRFKTSVGFDDIKTEDIDDLRKDEGPACIKELAELLKTLNGGILPPVQRVLPLVLSYAGGTKTSTGEAVEENSGGYAEVKEIGETGPNTDVGSSQRTSGGDGLSEENGDSGAGEQMGENSSPVG
jgi:hypothetical protein